MESSRRSFGPLLVAGIALLALLIAGLLLHRERRALQRAEQEAARADAHARGAVEELARPSAVPPDALGREIEWEAELRASHGIREHAIVAVRVGHEGAGAALVGADVQIVLEHPDGRSVSRSTQTDVIGVATFECRAGETVREVRVPPTASRAGGWRTLAHTLLARRVFGASVVIREGARLEGRVVDASGAPVAGAAVALTLSTYDSYASYPSDAQQITDELGRYAFDHAGPVYVLTASHHDSSSGFAGISVEALAGEITDASTRVLPDLTIVAVRSIAGRVTDEAGAPIGGAVVRARVPVAAPGALPRHLPERITEHGEFSITVPAVEAGCELEVALLASGAREVVHVPPSRSRVDVVLRGGRELGGRVVDASWEGIAGARVELLGPSPRSALTDADGAFLLQRVPAAPGALFADAGARGTAWLALTAEHFASAKSLAVPLDPPVEIRGRVLDEAGAPLEGALVLVTSEHVLAGAGGAPWDRVVLAGADQAACDELGRFVLARLWPGRFVLEVRHPDEPDLVLQADVVAPESALELRWDRPRLRRVVIAGAVSDAATGAPLAGFDVLALREREADAGDDADEAIREGTLRRFHDAAGRFEIAGLAPGAYRVHVRASGYVPAELELGALDEGEHAVELALAPLAPVELAFVDPSGAPLAAGSVTVRRADGSVLAPDGSVLTPDGALAHDGSVPTHDGEVLDASGATGGDPRAAARALEHGRVRALVPAELLEIELALGGGERLSYLLDPSSEAGDAIFVVDLDANATRESAAVLVCAVVRHASVVAPGWHDELPADRRALHERGELAPFDGDALEIDVRDRNGALVGRARLERAGEAWRSSFALAHGAAGAGGERALPIVDLELPRRGFRLAVRADGHEPLDVRVEELRAADLDSSRALVLRRAAR